MIFVVPTNIQLTPAQTAIMIEAGQQPGVPFYLSENGPASRPKAAHFKSNYIKHLMSIKRRSILLINESEDIYSIQLDYDSAIPCDLSIRLGVTDLTNSSKIM